MNVGEKIYVWMVTPAKRWQFWRPGSGLVGGATLGIIIGLTILAYLKLSGGGV